MGSVFGNSIKLTLFGESHGPAVLAVLDGLPPGLAVDMGYISAEMDRRRASGSLSTARREPDVPEFISGVKDGFTEGTPLAVLIRNTNVKREDYDGISGGEDGTGSCLARPSHADFTAQSKYLGYQDASGGGHFSGRLTAPIVAACAVLKQALEKKGIKIETQIKEVGGTEVLGQPEKAEKIIAAAAAEGDSVGGVLQTTITGLEAGTGEPFFDSLESLLAHAMFSIPAVKGVEFGAGFAIAAMKGSQANDAFAVRDGRVVTLTNNSGGINGGISNGMPIVFRTAFRPTPSIAKTQKTVDLRTLKETEISIKGRHDPAIVRRAVPVVDAITALVLADLLARRFGYMWLAENK